MPKEALCERFNARIAPLFPDRDIDARMVRMRSDDTILVSYTHMPAGRPIGFMRFILIVTTLGCTVEAAIMRYVGERIVFEPIRADDEAKALDKLADWFQSNKELIMQESRLYS